MIPTLLFAEPAHVSSGFKDLGTSDGYDLRSYKLNYRSHRQDESYPYEGAKASFDWGVDFNRYEGHLNQTGVQSESIEIIGGRQTEGFHSFEAGLGVQNFQGQSGDSQSFIGKMSASGPISKTFNYSFGVSRRLLLDLGYVPGPVEESLSEWRVSPAILWRPQERIKVSLSQDYAIISDDNRRYHVESSAMYGISIWPLWFWAGVGAEYLTNSENGDYWSPTSFKSYGLRSELSYEFKSYLALSTGFNKNRIQENNRPWGNGHYWSTGLRLGERNSNHLQVYYIDNESAQTGSRWRYEAIEIQLNLFF